MEDKLERARQLRIQNAQARLDRIKSLASGQGGGKNSPSFTQPLSTPSSANTSVNPSRSGADITSPFTLSPSMESLLSHTSMDTSSNLNAGILNPDLNAAFAPPSSTTSTLTDSALRRPRSPQDSQMKPTQSKKATTSSSPLLRRDDMAQ
ncbi:hypothetical protein HMI55_000902, partial [Coelomomyces lativittatus]